MLRAFCAIIKMPGAPRTYKYSRRASLTLHKAGSAFALTAHLLHQILLTFTDLLSHLSLQSSRDDVARCDPYRAVPTQNFEVLHPSLVPSIFDV